MMMGYYLRGLSMVLVMWANLCCDQSVSGIHAEDSDDYMKGVGRSSSSPLELHFYRKRCPNAELIVKEEMKVIMLTDPTTAPALLRLAFHDCQVDGCDALVLLREPAEGSVMETLSEKNFGIRKLEIIDLIKSSLEEHCPQTVSCADIIQLAAREAIYLAGGPYIQVLTGRRDSISASRERADKQLPMANISVDEFIEIFGQKNISLEQGVALIGAHTLGISHCRNFMERLRPTSDPTLPPIYSFVLQTICSNPSGFDITFSVNDATALTFDNHYFIDIQSGRGLLRIDSDIARDPRTLPHVVKFGRDMHIFFDTFSAAFLKLSTYNVLIGQIGEIRKDCRYTNS